MVDVNYFAILASGVASLVLGFFWYGPLFGKSWMKLMGMPEMSKEEIKGMQKKAMPGYGVSFVGALVMAYVLSHHMAFAGAYLGTEGIELALMSAFWVWLGFFAPVTIGSVLWEQRPLKLWCINAGYWLVLLGVIATILALWV